MCLFIGLTSTEAGEEDLKTDYFCRAKAGEDKVKTDYFY
jgi:hypothetical protein